MLCRASMLRSTHGTFPSSDALQSGVTFISWQRIRLVERSGLYKVAHKAEGDGDPLPHQHVRASDSSSGMEDRRRRYLRPTNSEDTAMDKHRIEGSAEQARGPWNKPPGGSSATTSAKPKAKPARLPEKSKTGP